MAGTQTPTPRARRGHRAGGPGADRPVRRRLEPDARREEILSCAVRLFGEQPYEQVSTGDVAAAAGVARGLVNHYFGTKKDLYLEVVRALVTIPDVVLDHVPRGGLDERVDAAVTWFLDAVARHARPWLMAIGATGPGNHPDVAAVIAQADEVTVDHILTLAGWDPLAADPELRAATRAYVAFARAGAVQWLVQGTLTRGQAQVLLARTLVSLLTDVAPRLRAAQDRPDGAGQTARTARTGQTDDAGTASGEDPGAASTTVRSRSRLRRSDGPTSASS